MNPYPVISSILHPEGLAQWAQQKFFPSASVRCELLKTGINHTYKITTEAEAYVLRVYSFQWRSREAIEEELGLLILLKENNIAVSFPIKDLRGDYVHAIAAPEGERYAVLFSYAKGQKLHTYGQETHEAIGRIMARMHGLTLGRKQEHRPEYTSETLLDRSVTAIEKFLPHDTDEMRFLQETKVYLKTELEKADTSQLRQGLVHMDIWFDNLNIADNHQVTLFDFDFCGNGWLCLDLAYYILQTFNTEKDPEQRQQKTEAFFRGYESLQTISAEEKRLLPLLGICMYYFYLGIQCQRFDNWSNTFLNESYLKRYITVLIKGYIEGR